MNIINILILFLSTVSSSCLTIQAESTIITASMAHWKGTNITLRVTLNPHRKFVDVVVCGGCDRKNQ